MSDQLLATAWSGKAAAEIAGISYRQLDYWARTDLVRPSIADANGSGSRRRYSYDDLVQLAVIRALLDAGVQLGTVRDLLPAVGGDEVGYLVVAGATVARATTLDQLGPVLATLSSPVSTLVSVTEIRLHLDLALLDYAQG